MKTSKLVLKTGLIMLGYAAFLIALTLLCPAVFANYTVSIILNGILLLLGIAFFVSMVIDTYCE